MKTVSSVLIMPLLGVVLALGQTPADYRSHPDQSPPPQGWVPDEKTAITIAEAVLRPIFGEKAIRKERPLGAALDGGRWVVTSHQQSSHDPNRIVVGGSLHVEIDKMTGKILSAYHSK